MRYPADASGALAEEWRQHVCNVAQRPRERSGPPSQGRPELWRIWPKLAGGLNALDEALEQPVAKRGMWDTTQP